MRTYQGNMKNRAMLLGFVATLWGIFHAAWIADPRFRRAVRSFRAVYKFRSGSAVGSIVFSPNGIRMVPGETKGCDFELEFIDLPTALDQMLNDPNDVIQLLLENKVDQEGNIYYLFRLGYLMELCRPYIQAISPGAEAAIEYVKML